MTRAEPCAVRSPLRGWPAVLCVLGVLVGLLAMHGLAPGGLHAVGHGHAAGTAAASAMTPGSGMGPGPGTVPASGTAPAMSEAGAGAHADVSAGGCSGDGHCGGHARHADATCAAAKVSGTPVLAGPVADPIAVVVPDGAVRCDVRADSEAARAPPSLAELQLLRI